MSRSISIIAREVRQDWKKVSPHAAPYLEAMGTLESINEKYYYDSARSVVAYFLSNATGWRGDKAKAIKKELKEMLAGG
jgi:hypothetical protein